MRSNQLSYAPEDAQNYSTHVRESRGCACPLRSRQHIPRIDHVAQGADLEVQVRAAGTTCASAEPIVSP